MNEKEKTKKEKKKKEKNEHRSTTTTSRINDNFHYIWELLHFILYIIIICTRKIISHRKKFFHACQN